MPRDLSSRTTRRLCIVAAVLAVLVAGLGVRYVLGAGSTTSIGGTLSGTVSASAPQVYRFNLNTTGNASRNGQALDVLTTYRFDVTVYAPNGWRNVSKMYFNLWYDNGTTTLTYVGQGAWANFKANLSYSNAAQNTTPDLGQWSVTFGNLVYVRASSWIRANVAGSNYTFGIAFSLNAQMHRATTPASPSTTGYANLRSWNAQFGVENTTGTVFWQRTNTTGFYLEFGVTQYTSLSLSTSLWSATGIAPGTSANTNTVTVTYASNGNFSANVTLSSLLTSGSNTIPASSVTVTGGTKSGAAFAGIGPTNTIYLYGSNSTWVLQSASANSQTFTVFFTIAVPIGTPVGTYTAPVVLTITQSPTP